MSPQAQATEAPGRSSYRELLWGMMTGMMLMTSVFPGKMMMGMDLNTAPDLPPTPTLSPPSQVTRQRTIEVAIMGMDDAYDLSLSMKADDRHDSYRSRLALPPVTLLGTDKVSSTIQAAT
jgi:hypothetical protein